MKNLLLNIIKWCLYIVFIPIFWIYGFFWLLFASRNHSDASISIHALLTIISVCICGAFLLRTPNSNIETDSVQEMTITQAEEPATTSNTTYHTNYKEPYTPAEIEAGYIDVLLPVSYSIPSENVTEEVHPIQNEEPVYNEEPVVLQEVPVYVETPAITEEVTVYTENATYAESENTDETYKENIQGTVYTEPVYDTNTSTSSRIVWIDDTADKYHSSAEQPNHNFKMDHPYAVTEEEAIGAGKKPCGICYR